MTADANSVVGNLINAIENELAVETNLEELRIVLGALDATSLKEACVNIRWIVVFNCLNSQNETHITEGCKVLRLVLPALPNAVILLREDIPGALARCLNHPHVTVKLMALDEIKRLICTDEMGFFLVRTHGKAALMGIFDCMGHEEASVGLRAVQIITTLGRTKVGTGILCRVDIATAALEKTKGSEIHRIRLNEALVEIGASSEDALRQFEILGYFSDLISSVKTDDILANLAVLEVLTPLTETWHGHEFLHRHGITQLLVEMLVTAKDHPLRSLFYPGVVKFFGHLGRDSSKQVARDYPAVFRTIFNMSESTEEVIFITSLEAIGMIAYNRGGKSHMMAETAMSGLMKRVYAAITQVPSNWKERGLKVLGNIIHVEPEDIKTDFAAVVQSWFEEMSPHGFETVSEMARNPFPDVKVPALEVLTELASMKWGQTKIANNQPLLEYLLSPKEEDGEAKAAKLQLLRVLANSDTSPSVFGEELFVKIRDAALETKSNGGQVIVEMMSV